MYPQERRVLLPPDLQPVTSLEAYKAQGGLAGLEKARSMSRDDLIALVKASGLRGRGGAGFPTAIKWETVYKALDPKKYVVCNGAEGEPGTYKDRYLLGKNPYVLLEGMLIAAYAIDARQAILGTKEKFKDIVLLLKRALKEFETAGLCPPGYLRIVLGPDEYLLGEEKGLMEAIDGRAPMPRFFPPFMVGVGAGPTETNPTVVNNVETVCHLPHIVSKGPEWFRSNGSPDTPGTMILTLTGDVRRPGMYEVSLGLTVRELIYDIGGGPRDEAHPIKAVLSGCSNRVMVPDQFDLRMEFGTLRQAGLGLGSGGFMVYDDTRNMVDIAWMISNFLAVSSCGQCVPCNMGTRVITGHLRNLRSGKGTRQDLEAIRIEAGRCTSQTRCFLPTQESIVIPSLMDVFFEDFEKAATQGYVALADPLIPKIQYFDEAQGRFVMEPEPVEFRPENALFH